ncbi:unnamed protein product [Paramecium pentaurelia]|uniref:Transmembrane protein n=1 Tax=Paramecium pentaurelia TaxID=43138 RepID=A0A8S1WKU4_9CILI|nr:unnamed protein product [Paramecium pentaurelia]
MKIILIQLYQRFYIEDNFREAQNLGIQVFFANGEFAIIALSYFIIYCRWLAVSVAILSVLLNIGNLLIFEYYNFYTKKIYVKILNQFAKLNGTQQIKIDDLVTNQSTKENNIRVYSILDLLKIQIIKELLTQKDHFKLFTNFIFQSHQRNRIYEYQFFKLKIIQNSKRDFEFNFNKSLNSRISLSFQMGKQIIVNTKCIFCWSNDFFAIKVTYYGISFFSDQLGLNFFTTNFLITLFEFLAFAILGFMSLYFLFQVFRIFEGILAGQFGFWVIFMCLNYFCQIFSLIFNISRWIFWQQSLSIFYQFFLISQFSSHCCFWDHLCFMRFTIVSIKRNFTLAYERKDRRKLYSQQAQYASYKRFRTNYITLS